MIVFARSCMQHLAHNVCPLHVLSSDGSLLFTLTETAHKHTCKPFPLLKLAICWYDLVKTFCLLHDMFRIL